MSLQPILTTFALSPAQVRELMNLVLDFGKKHNLQLPGLPFALQGVADLIKDECVKTLRNAGATDAQIREYTQKSYVQACRLERN